MATIKATATTADFTAPDGTVVDHYVITLSDGQKTIIAAADIADTQDVSFTVQPGTITATFAAYAADGVTVIGSVITSDSIVIDTPAPVTITVKVASGITLTQ